jgi:uncharacterized RDD family membrane protein YckC
VSVRVAGFWRRALAGGLDAALLSTVLALCDAGVALALGQPMPRLSQLGPDFLVDVAVNGSTLAEVGLTLAALVGFLYFFIFHALGGRTPGKRLCGLRVIDGYGRAPSVGRALGRTAAYGASALLLALGFLWIGFDREKRGLHDWLADTYVISDGAA